jgi:hypothetical protein
VIKSTKEVPAAAAGYELLKNMRESPSDFLVATMSWLVHYCLGLLIQPSRRIRPQAVETVERRQINLKFKWPSPRLP